MKPQVKPLAEPIKIDTTGSKPSDKPSNPTSKSLESGAKTLSVTAEASKASSSGKGVTFTGSQPMAQNKPST